MPFGYSSARPQNMYHSHANHAKWGTVLIKLCCSFLHPIPEDFLTHMQCKNQTLWQYQSRVRVFIVFYFLAGHLMSYAMVGLTRVSTLLKPIEVTYVCACSTVKDIPPLQCYVFIIHIFLCWWLQLVCVHWIRPWGGRDRNHSLFGCCLEGKGTLFPPIIVTLLE